MELKTIEDVKKEIGKKVKFGKGDNVSENLKLLDVLEGIIVSVDSNWEHTIDSDVCKFWVAHIDIVDPNDGGTHHLTANKIFSLDEKDDNIVNAKIIEQIKELENKIVVLQASKKKTEIIEEEKP